MLLGHVLTQQAVRILIAATLPGTVGIAEVDLDPGGDAELHVSSKFTSLLPGDGFHQRPRECLDGPSHRELDFGGAVTVREMQQKNKARAAFDERADRARPSSTDDGGSDRSALPAFELVGFSGPPAEPDVQLSPHPALHRVMPVVRGDPLSCRSSMVWGFGRADSGIG